MRMRQRAGVLRRPYMGGCSRWLGASVLSAAAGQSSRRQLLQLSTPRRRRLPFTCWLGRKGELTRVNAYPYTPTLTECGDAPVSYALTSKSPHRNTNAPIPSVTLLGTLWLTRSSHTWKCAGGRARVSNAV